MRLIFFSSNSQRLQRVTPMVFAAASVMMQAAFSMSSVNSDSCSVSSTMAAYCFSTRTAWASLIACIFSLFSISTCSSLVLSTTRCSRMPWVLFNSVCTSSSFWLRRLNQNASSPSSPRSAVASRPVSELPLSDSICSCFDILEMGRTRMRRTSSSMITREISMPMAMADARLL